MDFFLTKGKKIRKKKKKRDFLIRKTRTKRKKNWRRRSLVFCRFFRPVFFFLNIFQLLKKLSQLLCCFKDFLRESGKKKEFNQKKIWREGEVWSGLRGLYQTFLITIIQWFLGIFFIVVLARMTLLMLSLFYFSYSWFFPAFLPECI